MVPGDTVVGGVRNGDAVVGGVRVGDAVVGGVSAGEAVVDDAAYTHVPEPACDWR